MNLSFQEQLTCETIQDQTNDQLKYILNSFSIEGELNSVDFILTNKNQSAFLVPKQFYIDAVLNELGFRDVL